MPALETPKLSDPFKAIQAGTDKHRASHGCWAYPFQDGPALGVIAAAAGAKRVLELGTALGYTACWFAHGSPAAKVDTIEQDDDHVRLARANIARAGFGDRVTVHHGAFVSIIPDLPPGFDIAFFDGYAPTLADLDMLTRMLRPGGVLITTNLGLGGEAARYVETLCDPKLWMTAFMAESGRTAVSVRR
jgi:predicted O-methyltransferase YrrM